MCENKRSKPGDRETREKKLTLNSMYDALIFSHSASRSRKALTYSASNADSSSARKRKSKLRSLSTIHYEQGFESKPLF
jgi:hypothetical protein